MYRIVFTIADIPRTKVATSFDPVLETLFAVELFVRQGGGSHFARWRELTNARLGRRARQLTNIARVLRPVPDILEMVNQAAAFEDSGGRLVSGTRNNVLAAIHAFHKVAVAPYRPRISAYLKADCAARGRIILNGGFDRFLETLHANAQWSTPVLSIPNRRDEEIHLDGRGLRLVPSLFLFDRPVLIDTPDGSQPILAFPVPPDLHTASALWDAGAGGNSMRSLGALVGRTRAAIIDTLSDGCSTSELSRRVGISSAAASQHTAILREAGLITTHRKLNTSLHTLTPLGVALLNGDVQWATPTAATTRHNEPNERQLITAAGQSP